MAQNMKRNALGFEINQNYVEMYEMEVKKTVSNEWEEMLSWRETMKNSLENFEKTIMNLRVLKYSWYAIKAINDFVESDEIGKIKAVICVANIPPKYIKGEKIPIKIWILGEKNHRFFNNLVKKISERMNLPPLTYYGITSNILSNSIESFLKNYQMKDQLFFLYPNKKAKTYIAKKQTP